MPWSDRTRKWTAHQPISHETSRYEPSVEGINVVTFYACCPWNSRLGPWRKRTRTWNVFQVSLGRWYSIVSNNCILCRSLWLERKLERICPLPCDDTFICGLICLPIHLRFQMRTNTTRFGAPVEGTWEKGLRLLRPLHWSLQFTPTCEEFGTFLVFCIDPYPGFHWKQNDVKCNAPPSVPRFQFEILWSHRNAINAYARCISRNHVWIQPLYRQTAREILCIIQRNGFPYVISTRSWLQYFMNNGVTCDSLAKRYVVRFQHVQSMSSGGWSLWNQAPIGKKI